MIKIDDRNQGGKNLIINQFYNHHKGILNIKPYIQLEAPKQPKTKTLKCIQMDQKQLLRDKDQFDMAYKTLTTVNQMKKGIVNTKQNTITIKTKLSNKYDKLQLQNHIHNQVASYKRIEAIKKRKSSSIPLKKII